MKQGKNSPKWTNVDVSIVVAARNEEDSLESCINNMPKNERIELIVVDDASEDDTREIASKSNVTLYGFEKARGAASAWDHGARKAKGSQIQLVGADSWVDDPIPYLKYFKDDRVVQVLPRVVNEGDNLMARIQRIHDRLAILTHDMFFGTDIAKQSQNVTVLSPESDDIHVVPWSHALMRKSFYLEVDPPVDLGVGEEHRFEEIATAIIKDKGYKLVYDPSFVYHWGLYTTLVRRLKQQKYYGRCLWFNIKSLKSVLKFFPLCVPLSIIAMPFNSLLSLLFISPIFFRFLLGLRVLKPTEYPLYPAFIVVTLIEHIAFSLGCLENLAHRLLRGRFMAYK